MASNFSSFKEIADEVTKQRSAWQAVVEEINAVLDKIKSAANIRRGDSTDLRCSYPLCGNASDIDQQQYLFIRFDAERIDRNKLTANFEVRDQKDFERFCHYYAVDICNYRLSDEAMADIEKIWPELTKIKIPENPAALTPEIPVLGRPKLGGRMPAPLTPDGP